MVLAFAAGGLADVTNLWWLVLVFGAAVPILFVTLQNRSSRGARDLPPDRKGERQVLNVLREREEVTAASAAMLTTLTVDGASGILEALTRKGHLGGAGPRRHAGLRPARRGQAQPGGNRRRRPTRPSRKHRRWTVRNLSPSR